MPLRVSAYYPLHYGREYLAYSIRSIYDHIAKIFLVYSKRPTHGVMNRWPNPDWLEDLQEAVSSIRDVQGKIEWHIGDYWGRETYHREFGAELVFLRDKADICLNIDHDEIFDGDSLEEAIALAVGNKARRFRLNFIHLWRSFNWACTDQMMPTRLRKRDGQGEEYLHLAKPVYHFGYAQRPELVDYKMSIHGHRVEFRQPARDWFVQKFLAWRPDNGISDVHPVVVDIWHPKPFDKWELPEIMREHPYWDREIIE